MIHGWQAVAAGVILWWRRLSVLFLAVAIIFGTHVIVVVVELSFTRQQFRHSELRLQFRIDYEKYLQSSGVAGVRHRVDVRETSLGSVKPVLVLGVVSAGMIVTAHRTDIHICKVFQRRLCRHSNT